MESQEDNGIGGAGKSIRRCLSDIYEDETPNPSGKEKSRGLSLSADADLYADSEEEEQEEEENEEPLPRDINAKPGSVPIGENSSKQGAKDPSPSSVIDISLSLESSIGEYARPKPSVSASVQDEAAQIAAQVEKEVFGNNNNNKPDAPSTLSPTSSFAQSQADGGEANDPEVDPYASSGDEEEEGDKKEAEHDLFMEKRIAAEKKKEEEEEKQRGSVKTVSEMDSQTFPKKKLISTSSVVPGAQPISRASSELMSLEPCSPIDFSNPFDSTAIEGTNNIKENESGGVLRGPSSYTSVVPARSSSSCSPFSGGGGINNSVSSCRISSDLRNDKADMKRITDSMSTVENIPDPTPSTATSGVVPSTTSQRLSHFSNHQYQSSTSGVRDDVGSFTSPPPSKSGEKLVAQWKTKLPGSQKEEAKYGNEEEIVASEQNETILVSPSKPKKSVLDQYRELLGGSLPVSSLHPDESVSVGSIEGKESVGSSDASDIVLVEVEENTKKKESSKGKEEKEEAVEKEEEIEEMNRKPTPSPSSRGSLELNRMENVSAEATKKPKRLRDILKAVYSDDEGMSMDEERKELKDDEGKEEREVREEREESEGEEDGRSSPVLLGSQSDTDEEVLSPNHSVKPLLSSKPSLSSPCPSSPIISLSQPGDESPRSTTASPVILPRPWTTRRRSTIPPEFDTLSQADSLSSSVPRSRPIKRKSPALEHSSAARALSLSSSVPSSFSPSSPILKTSSPPHVRRKRRAVDDSEARVERSRIPSTSTSPMQKPLLSRHSEPQVLKRVKGLKRAKQYGPLSHSSSSSPSTSNGSSLEASSLQTPTRERKGIGKKQETSKRKQKKTNSGEKKMDSVPPSQSSPNRGGKQQKISNYFLKGGNSSPPPSSSSSSSPSSSTTTSNNKKNSSNSVNLSVPTEKKPLHDNGSGTPSRKRQLPNWIPGGKGKNAKVGALSSRKKKAQSLPKQLEVEEVVPESLKSPPSTSSSVKKNSSVSKTGAAPSSSSPSSASSSSSKHRPKGIPSMKPKGKEKQSLTFSKPAPSSKKKRGLRSSSGKTKGREVNTESAIEEEDDDVEDVDMVVIDGDQPLVVEYHGESDDENEDFCFECKDGGDLLCCDTCPRSYHLKCIHLRVVPACPKWLCRYCLNMHSQRTPSPEKRRRKKKTSVTDSPSSISSSSPSPSIASPMSISNPSSSSSPVKKSVAKKKTVANPIVIEIEEEKQPARAVKQDMMEVEDQEEAEVEEEEEEEEEEEGDDEDVPLRDQMKRKKTFIEPKALALAFEETSERSTKKVKRSPSVTNRENEEEKIEKEERERSSGKEEASLDPEIVILDTPPRPQNIKTESRHSSRSSLSLSRQTSVESAGDTHAYASSESDTDGEDIIPDSPPNQRRKSSVVNRGKAPTDSKRTGEEKRGDEKNTNNHKNGKNKMQKKKKSVRFAAEPTTQVREIERERGDGRMGSMGSQSQAFDFDEPTSARRRDRDTSTTTTTGSSSSSDLSSIPHTHSSSFSLPVSQSTASQIYSFGDHDEASPLLDGGGSMSSVPSQVFDFDEPILR